jgi:predicted RNA binding protein YcfA (HicA-like mRNA interferase family)
MNRRRLLARLASGKFNNVAFRDATALVQAFGFELSRVEGSHHIFIHPQISELVNLQDVNGEAKPYQLRQFLRLVERYDLRLKDER